MRREVESDHRAFFLQTLHGYLGVIARVQNLLAYQSNQRHGSVLNCFSRFFHTSRTLSVCADCRKLILCRAALPSCRCVFSTANYTTRMWAWLEKPACVVTCAPLMYTRIHSDLPIDRVRSPELGRAIFKYSITK